ncbi:MAG: hypothetical protein DRH08_00020 [Deltaproteobacteria bacterium]|nr:MAG: hypothetical protein DRH08_00020 [Deltaproteobacteria bacterium]
MVTPRFAAPSGYEVLCRAGRLHGRLARRGWHRIDTDEVLALLRTDQLLALRRGELVDVGELDLSIRARVA